MKGGGKTPLAVVEIKPRMRFDKVAVALIARLQKTLDDVVPEGKAVIITITAPIRRASKTAAVLEERVPKLLARRSARVDWGETIQGNQVRVRVVNKISAKSPKVVAFVHNPDPGAAEVLLDTAQSLS